MSRLLTLIGPRKRLAPSAAVRYRLERTAPSPTRRAKGGLAKRNPDARPCPSTRRANHQNPVHPLAKKHSASVVGQISAIGSPRLTREEGRCARHERCGGMRWTRVLATDERLNLRTAKSCGPDAPTLALSWRRRVVVSLRK